jgi:beta-mannanase
MYYPGDDYVDIVALDVYVDEPVILTCCSNI